MTSALPNLTSLGEVGSSNIRRLYNSKAWRIRRKAQLEDHPLCQDCEARGDVVSANTADHITPHRGNEELFYNGDLRSLCPTCHSKRKQQEELRGYSTEIGADGWPIDPEHPFHTGKETNVRRTALMARPMWFRKVYIPLTIVCGPPGSGKSTYVRKQAGPDDLVICFDTIAVQTLGSRQEQGRARVRLLSPKDVGDVLRARNELLADLMRARARERWPQAWLIISEPLAENRQWWVDTVAPHQVVVLEVPVQECLRRVQADADAGDPRPTNVAKTIGDWWHKYTRRQDEVHIPYE